MPTQALPEANDIRDLLNGLLGRDIGVVSSPPDALSFDKKVVVAVYLRDDDKIGGIVVADLSLAIYSGAALSMLPKGVADESVAEGAIEDALYDNFYECLNIGAQWFAAKGSPRVKLTQVYPPSERPPNDVAQLMSAPAERQDWEVTVGGYGKGTARFLATSF